jgi:type II secretory pathway component HofQ
MLLLTVTSGAAASRRTVTLDVKDAEVHTVLRSMQKQCGIKNLIIDPGVSGSATFYFRDVPCETAFRAVLRTYGLTAQFDLPTMINVGARPR